MQSDRKYKFRSDPYTIPPNIAQCYIHQASSQFGVPKRASLQQLNELHEEQLVQTSSYRPSMVQRGEFGLRRNCQCCGEVAKEKLHGCCRIEDIYKVNESLGFYFTYIKVMFLMVLATGILIGAFSLKQLITNCNLDVNCMKVYGITISRFHVFFNSINTILVVCVIIIMYGFTIYLYYTNAHQHRKIFMNLKKPTNFSVLLSNINHQNISQKDILSYFQHYSIQRILYTHSIKNYLQQIKQKSQLIALKNLYLKKDPNPQTNSKINQINSKIHSINQYLSSIKSTLTPQQQKTVRTDKIIIKFKTFSDKLRFDLTYRKNFCQFFQQTFCHTSLIQINNHKIYTQNIGEPNQILWENFQINANKRLFRVISGSFLSLLVLAASYLIAAFITRLQQSQSLSSDYLLSILFSSTIQISNLIMQEIIQRLTEWQKRYTLTSKYRVITVKIFILYFLNTTIMPFSLFLFDWGTKTEEDQILNVFTVFCILNFQLPVPFVVNFIRIPHIVKYFMRRKILQQGQNSLVPQIQANKFFERFDFELHSKFVKVLQIVSNTVFYAAVFPLGLVITLAGLVLTYWSSKVFLLEHCTIPKQSYRLGRLVNDITAFFPTILAFGYGFNELMIPGKTEFNRIAPLIIGVLTIPIGILFITFGHKMAEKMVAKRYGGLRESVQMERNEEALGNGELDYRDLNPTSFIQRDQFEYKIKEPYQLNVENMLQNYSIEKETINS